MKGSFVADMWNKLAHKSRDFCTGHGVEDLQINNREEMSRKGWVPFYRVGPSSPDPSMSVFNCGTQLITLNYVHN